MSELTEQRLREEIRQAADRVEPITIDEIKQTPRARSNFDTGVRQVLPTSMLSSEPRRYWLLGLSAAAALLLLVLASGGQGDNSTVTDDGPAETVPSVKQEDSTIDVAVRFSNALVELDIERARRLSSSSVSVEDPGWGNTFDEKFAVWSATGVRFTVGGCEQLEDPQRAACPVTLSDLISRSENSEPLTGTFEIVVDEGLVNELTFESSSWTGYINRVYLPYIEWVRVNHPDEYANLYPIGPGSTPPLTDENLSMLRDLVRSYASEQHFDEVTGLP